MSGTRFEVAVVLSVAVAVATGIAASAGAAPPRAGAQRGGGSTGGMHLLWIAQVDGVPDTTEEWVTGHGDRLVSREEGRSSERVVACAHVWRRDWNGWTRRWGHA